MGKNRILLASSLAGFSACVITWLLGVGTSSPLENYLLQNPLLRNLWGELNFPVIGIAMVFGLPNSDFVGYPLVFLQWFFLSLGLGLTVRFLLGLQDNLNFRN